MAPFHPVFPAVLGVDMSLGRPESSDKIAVRTAAATIRREACASAGEQAGPALILSFAALTVRPGVVVAGYWPMRDEMDVRPLMTDLSRRGFVTALPVVADRDAPLRFRRWAPGMELDAGPHRTVHPPVSAGEVAPDVVLVPLLAFDGHGGRLGYGGGYYDRTLQALRRRERKIIAVGVAFAAQRRDDLPLEPHDQRLDWVITEKGALETGS